MSNLEPIEEGDLNLKEKFLGGNAPKIQEEKKESAPEVSQEEKVEIPVVPENPVERKEGQAEKDAAYAKIISITKVDPEPEEKKEIAADAQKASVEQDAQSKIENLVKLAEVKGLPHAVKVAKHLEDNYVLDEFHDRLLSEELHKALVEKGMIKEF